MKHLISAVERQIKIQEGFIAQRDVMLSNKDEVVFERPLAQDANPEYLQELKEILPLLKYLSSPLPEWNEVIDGSISVPDELDDLVNKIGFQIRFHTISGKGETETVCSIAAIAQKFFHQYRPQ